MAEEKWWMAPSLSEADRGLMSPEMRLERRSMLVQRRLGYSDKKLSATRDRRMTKLMDQWFRGRVMRELMHDGPAGNDAFYSLKAWLRKQFVLAVESAVKEIGISVIVERIIQDKVSDFHRNNGHNFIKTIIEDEVRKQIIGKITIDATITGTVRPAP